MNRPRSHSYPPARPARPTVGAWALALVFAVGLASVGLASAAPSVQAQQLPRDMWEGVPEVTLADVTLLHTADEPDILVRVLARGLAHPWSLAFLPNGDLLVTERPGRLRVIRDGVLDPEPVSGLPAIHAEGIYAGLLEVALHPDFEENRLVYLSYITADEYRGIALARARFDGRSLHDFEDVFRATPERISVSGSRLLFAPDGTLFMPVGGAFNAEVGGLRAQDPSQHAGKILRLNDDGTAPDDNPFVGREGYLPEIYSLGHRNPMGMAFHPETGELWVSEHSTQGGDEVNIVRPGRNYGWPIVSFGREYLGPRVSERFWDEGIEDPVVLWIPSVGPSGMTFYTGDRFPNWRGDLFVGAMRVGRIYRTGRLERILLNEAGEEVGRESILTELQQRIRDVRQGPDGLLYVLTDEEDGALLRIEPAG